MFEIWRISFFKVGNFYVANVDNGDVFSYKLIVVNIFVVVFVDRVSVLVSVIGE